MTSSHVTSSHGRGLLHLAAGVDQPGVREADSYVELVRLAERGGLDFVTLDDASAGPGSGPGFDASAVLSRAALVTHRVGLVPAFARPVTTLTEPFAALDQVSRGRAGWRLGLPGTEGTKGKARLPGSRQAGDAETWDGAAARFTDRDKPRRTNHVDSAADSSPSSPSSPSSDSAGSGGSVGSSGSAGAADDSALRSPQDHPRPPQEHPRPPQGYPVRVVDAVDAAEEHGLVTAARYADVVLVPAASSAQARAVRDLLRREAAESGRDPDSLRVLVRLLIDLGDGEHAAEPSHGGGGPRQTAQGPLYRGGPVDLADLIASWHQDGAVDGFHLTPVEPRRDLERLVNGTVALLQHRSLFRTFYPGSTLREHLGLGRPAQAQYAAGTM
ncbi:LLM class flavin-dependent oxidoreductase [Streptomyces sp. NBC_01275]|uniref:LLM class flavin-dependent oxidoreductase n=1 Tax=Streptomyces sp. NBC_01275 TaxID=2903807 RepID=UPI002251DBBE|nr:LLM class flavin-dependent oxidoreductase [Streptomyces sp. NBC_01275]MCX4760910.1 LLM class flavin-dependent oxidoreductase [Streptomyces sp. NBC_01275]